MKRDKQFEEWYWNEFGQFEDDGWIECFRIEEGDYYRLGTRMSCAAWQASRKTLEIALTVLEQDESDGDVFIVMRNPGKVPDIKRPVGDVDDYLIQLYQQNPEAACDVVTYRFAGASGQWVQDGREHLAMMEVDQPTTPQIDNDGWVEWKGGECPVPDATPVEVKFRKGTSNRKELAGDWGWLTDADEPRPYDIIAYRVIENDGREG